MDKRRAINTKAAIAVGSKRKEEVDDESELRQQKILVERESVCVSEVKGIRLVKAFKRERERERAKANGRMQIVGKKVAQPGGWCRLLGVTFF